MNLFKHQERAMYRILENGNTALFSEMGTGKTIIALATFRNLIELVPELKCLVICPISLINAAWATDNQKTYKFPFQNLRHRSPIKEETRLFLINYESAKLVHYREIIESLAKRGPMLCVLDESSKIKNIKSQVTKFCLKIAPLFPYRLVMSGTPAPNSELEYWAQLKFLDPGIVPASFYAFRNTYFVLSRGAESHPQELNVRYATADHFRAGFKYRLRAGMRERFNKVLADNSFRIKKENCLDLPPVLDVTREVKMTSAQGHMYKFMRKEAVAVINDKAVSVQNALTKAMKLRQITSGFMYRTDDTGKTVAEELDISPKLRELASVLEEIGADKQVIVWIQFQWEAMKLLQSIPSAAVLNATTKDKDEVIEGFQEKKFRILIAHPASAGHGLTFVNCHYQVFYSLDYSAERYAQAKARIHRVGQTEKCLYIHLLCGGTIDEIIYEALQKKIAVQDLLYKL